MSAPATPSHPDSSTADATAKPISQLLADLGKASPHSTFSGSRPEQADEVFENRLAMVRLGMATALFYALRAKHPATSAHSLRVAIACSAWAERLRLPPDQRDRIEVAALLHDVGKIGIPDNILRKPGKLTISEQLTMDLYPRLGCEILRGCTDDAELLAIVRCSHAWFESRRDDDMPHGNQLPLGARMLAIVGAFDAMTTDHVYRPAMSRERALKELLDGAGTQFDPELVHDYCRMLETQPKKLQTSVVTRWLQQLSKEKAEGPWHATLCGSVAELRETPAAGHPSESVHRYYQQLFKQMNDGVIFLRQNGLVVAWNAAMERISGVSAKAICDQLWSPELIGLARDQQHALSNQECPLLACLASGGQQSHQMFLRRPTGEVTPVQVHVSAVVAATSEVEGVMAVVQDTTRQTTLEERLVDLHRKATQDALTGVENRGQFDRCLAELTDLAKGGGPTFSLVICDIDHFKQINDVHGHQAGDDALVIFAKVLASQARSSDVVCRYGGEEFCILAPATDNATATERAESIRETIEKTPINSLNGNTMTASFGVTEFQAGDSPETVLARADRALLRAKDCGRNQVIQLGSGRSYEAAKPSKPASGRWPSWLRWLDPGSSDERRVRVVTPVPADLAIEKLRGFIADHNAEILSVTENRLVVRMNVLFSQGGRRRVDHRLGFNVDMRLHRERPIGGRERTGPTQTMVDVKLQAIRHRDRRRRELDSCSEQVIASLNSYLMGSIVQPTDED